MKKVGWFIFVFFAVGVGLYPIIYALIDGKFGLLFSKSDELLANSLWWLAFYLHIGFGGVALLSGWSQFSQKWRRKYLNTHRKLGIVYFIAVMLSGTASIFIAVYATGGPIAKVGFLCLGIVWLVTSVFAFLKVKAGEITEHQKWAIRSYAICFSAVTLRLWLPLFQLGLQMDFFSAYKIIAWLCWVPNLVVAELIIRKLNLHKAIKVA